MQRGDTGEYDGTMQQQLETILDQLTSQPYIKPDSPISHEAYPTGIASFAYQTDGLSAITTHYWGDKESAGIHIYANVEDQYVLIAESLSFYTADDGSFDGLVYDHVVDLLGQEYDAVRRSLTVLLGRPSYVNDDYSDYAYERRHSSSEFWQRRDVPLEQQLIHHLGEFRLTYWQHGRHVIYLTLSHMDKEESVMLIVGSRPHWQAAQG